MTIEPFKGLLLGLFFVIDRRGARSLAGAGARRRRCSARSPCSSRMKTLLVLPAGARCSAAGAGAARDVGADARPRRRVRLRAGRRRRRRRPASTPRPGASPCWSRRCRWSAIPFVGRGLGALAARRRRAEHSRGGAGRAARGRRARACILVGYGRVGRLIGDMLEVHEIPLSSRSMPTPTSSPRRGARASPPISATRRARNSCATAASPPRARVVVTMDAPRKAEAWWSSRAGCGPT